MRPHGWHHGAVAELSRFPCRRCMYMPGSQTTRGGSNPRAIGFAPVAFCCHDGIGTPDCIAFAAHNLACTHPCQRFAGNLTAPTHVSGPVWDATPFTVMDSHLQPPAGLPAHRGSISHPTQLLCTLRGRRRRRAHATLATERALPLTRAGLSSAGSDQFILTHPHRFACSRSSNRHHPAPACKQLRVK